MYGDDETRKDNDVNYECLISVETRGNIGDIEDKDVRASFFSDSCSPKPPLLIWYFFISYCGGMGYIEKITLHVVVPLEEGTK